MDIMTLAAKLTLDSGAYEKGLKRAEGGMARLGKTLSAKTVALGTFAGNMLTKATSAAFRTLSNVVRSATDAYASYEQLTGGISTLFGTKEINNAKDYAKQIGLISEKVDKAGKTITTVNKKMAKTLFGDKSGKVTGKMTADEIAQRAYEQAEQAQKDAMDNAAKAYKSAGLSMNAYMDTATSLAASMNQATGGDTQKSASLIDMAIRDMADNANKMGTDMASVENAYRGFAKGNYTMLDNLKLGYGGTKTEMQRLLKDAAAITGEKYQMGNLADMVKAINAIQKQQGITGTTEKEAKGTIEGSKNMLKASWENVLTALAAPEDLDLSGALTSLTDSAKTYLKNLFPVVSTVVDGLGTFMEQVLPDVLEKLPDLIADFAPKLLKAGKKMLEGFGKGLKKVAAKIKIPTWDDVKTAATFAWNKIKEGAKKLGGLIFGQNPDGSIKWPTWDDVKAKAEEAWETIKTGAKKLGGLIFGNNPDGSIKWPTWKDVQAKAIAAWNTIRSGAKKLGGLIFGNNPDGSIKWPTWKDVQAKAVAAWDTIRSGAKKLGGLIFGNSPDGSIKWPTWKDVRAKAIEAWNSIRSGAKKLGGLIFGDTTTASQTFSNLLKDITDLKEKVEEGAIDIGKWFFGDENSETVVTSVKEISNAITAIGTAIAAITVTEGITKFLAMFKKGGEFAKIFGAGGTLATFLSENKLGLIIGSIAFLLTEVITHWDEIEPKLEEFGTWITKYILPPLQEVATWINENIIQPIADIIAQAKQFLGIGETGSGGKLNKDARDFLKNKWDAEGGRYTPQFGASVEKKLSGAGATETEIEQALAPLKSGEVDNSNIEDYLDSLTSVGEAGKTAGDNVKSGMDKAGSSANSASTAVESLGEDIAAVEGTHEIKFNITTTGSIPDIDGGGEGGGEGGGSGSHGFAKGLPTVPFDNYIAQLHRGEMVLTKSQARQYREGSSGNVDISGMAASIVAAVREGMAGAQVNSFLSGKKVTDDSNRRTSNMLRARRFATL